MAVFHGNTFEIIVNSVDLSDHVTAVDFPITYDDLDTTTMGANAKTRIAGLEDGSVTIGFNQDFAASKVYATIWPLRGTLTTITLKPTTAADGATNPKFSASFLVNQVTPISGKVGELSTMNVTWPKSGAITVDTTP